ncbi:FAD dependent oxidoreductase [Polychaeton citri CBS 116435]|uniref:FAD dependent oxidoreductase n=1 Tax=Polychaeton citri CBS 116435 TaxID=1314669 RepID=A0A9P4QCS2_9PEZI|nr:FAD dependent oxidoreductase [Polychaeton citri CBS 116435]
MAGLTPSSILIVGSGVFGVSTAHALAHSKKHSNTRIILLDRLPFPAHDGSSVDSSRIIRADYADQCYAALMDSAHPAWRNEYAKAGIYHEMGLALLLGEAPAEVGRKFMEESLSNVRGLGLKLGPREDGGQVEVMKSEEDVRRVMGTMGGVAAESGYVNWTSGWADAELGLRFMRQEAEKTGRIEFKTGEVRKLVFADNGSKVTGVQLADGQVVEADLTLLATGAWTPKLLDLRGIASASGQVLSYIAITPQEQERLSKNPVVLRDDGMFIIPPTRNELKIARHGYGYANPQTISNPELEAGASEQTITVSLPRTKHDDPKLDIPQEGIDACRGFLAKAIPDLADRPFTHTKICWYTDTPTADWLIDYHPKYKGLFVATGGSGHGYKFLPIIGERILDVISRQSRDELGEELMKKWKWPEQRHREDHIWTDDWRGGKKGMVLAEELRRGKNKL